MSKTFYLKNKQCRSLTFVNVVGAETEFTSTKVGHTSSVMLTLAELKRHRVALGRVKGNFDAVLRCPIVEDREIMLNHFNSPLSVVAKPSFSDIAGICGVVELLAIDFFT